MSVWDEVLVNSSVLDQKDLDTYSFLNLQSYKENKKCVFCIAFLASDAAKSKWSVSSAPNNAYYLQKMRWDKAE